MARSLDVAFIGFIRDELKFDSVDALIRQMDDDSARARAMLAAAPGAFPKLGRHRLSRSEKQKMLAGELYRPDDPELAGRAGGDQGLARALQRGAGCAGIASGTRCYPNVSAMSAKMR